MVWIGAAAESLWRSRAVPAHRPLCDPTGCVCESRPQAEPGRGQRSGLKAGSLCLSRGVELKARSLSWGERAPLSEQRPLLDDSAATTARQVFQACDKQCALL